MNGFVVNTRSLYRRVSGVERYTGEVINRLEKNFRCISPGTVKHPIAGQLWEQVALPRLVKSGELLWSPANTGPLAVRNQVLTLHDTSVLDHPEWFSPIFAAWYRWMLPRLVRRVRRVITVSEHSRQKILQTFSLPDERVAAIPSGVNLKVFQPAGEAAIARLRQKYRLEGDYLLFVGTLEPRKNLPLLVEAWQKVKEVYPRLELAIAGQQAFHFKAAQIMSGQAGLRLLGYVPEADLPALYSGASVSVLPSLSEGFGLTALEAMACGVPVIASRAGALPETVSSAGVLIDLQDANSLADASLRLLSDQSCWREYSRRGLEHVQHYSWQITASRVQRELEIAAREG